MKAATGAEFTVADTTLVVTVWQAFDTCALKNVVAVRLGQVYVEPVAPPMFAQGPPAAVALCHWTLPLWPVIKRFTGWPEQTLTGATAAVPATGAGVVLTVTEAMAVRTTGHSAPGSVTVSV